MDTLFIKFNAFSAGNLFQSHAPDETDMEFRTVVIAIEFISQSGDHIVLCVYYRTIRILDSCFFQFYSNARNVKESQ